METRGIGTGGRGVAYIERVCGGWGLGIGMGGEGG